MENNVNASIRVNLDTSEALSSLQSLQTRISSFNKSVIQSNAQAVAAQRGLLNNFQAEIGSSRQFSTSIRTSATEVSRLQTAIDKNKLSTGQYFKYAAASSKNFGKIFTQENEKITRLATERVRNLQTQYIALGEAQGGMQKSLLVKPLNLFNAEAAISVQKMQIFNKLLRDGGTSIVNWGKNTQWAGRQLMVGFTVPLTIFGATASKIFMDLEEQAISFKKVYGDIFTTTTEVEENLEAVRGLSEELTKYGIAITDTMETANVAAQAGFRGEDLMSQTQEATRLAVLGQMEQSEAMRTTITLQNAFKLSNEDLADAVNYLNIVENQTVLSIQDFAGAIPRVAPVIQSLGGDVRDLSVMLVAMREGGVTAAEGANALKTSLARLISPTSGASSMAKELGINLDGIVEANQGDILGAVMQLAKAMESLDELAQQRLLSEIFGKRQYARIGALFNNITDEASQSARALDLASMSVEQLAETAENELGVVEQAIGTKFAGAVERLKLAIAPIGETFLKIATPIINAAGNLLEKFNELSPTVKNFVAILATGVGIVVPSVLMLVGLFGNLLGNLVKGFGTLNTFFNRLKYGAEATQYLSGEQLDAAAAAASLEGQTTSLTGSLNIQREAVDQLSAAYRRYVAGANAAASNLPQGFRRPVTPATMATGGIVGGVGNKDTEPALLTPGEFVINADASKKFAPLLAAINSGQVGKYAKGRVPFNVGGETIHLDIASSQTENAINRRIEEATGLGEDALRALASGLKNISDDVNIYARDIDQALRQIPQLRGMESIQETDYSAPEFIRQQTVGMDWQTRASEIEAVQSRVAQNWELTESQVRNLVTTQASHLRVVDENGQRIAKSWENVANLTPDLGAVNNYLNRTERMTFDMSENSEVMQRLMQETGLEYSDVLRNVEELRRGTHPQDEIAMRVTSALGKIDEEYSLQALEAAKQAKLSKTQTEKMKTALGVTAVGGYQGAAVADIAATRGAAFYDPEEMATRSYVSAEQMTSAGVAGGRAGQGSNSPSRRMQEVGDEFAEGYVLGINDNRDEVVRASQAMTEAAVQSVSSGTSDIRVVLKEKLGVGPIVEQEQANLRENIALRKEENRLIERKMLLMASRGASPYGLRERAAAEIAAERAATSAPPAAGGMPYGLTMGPKSVQDDLIKATKNASNNLDNVGKQSGQVAKRFSRLKGGVSKFGGALKNGSVKMQGAFFALDGLVFAASMADNSLGKIAQQALPLVFGIQGLTMVLPLLANPIVLAGAALAAVAGGIWMLESKRKEAQQNLIDMSIAADGSAKAFRELAEEIGQMRPTERFAAILSGVKTEEEEQGLTEGQQFLESEAGQGMVERASSLAGKQRMTALQRELTSAISLQIITPDQAKSIARALSLSFNDPVLGQTLVSNISQYVRRSSKDVATAVNEMLKGVEQDIDDVEIAVALTDKETEELEYLLAKRNISTSANPYIEDDSGAQIFIERLTEEEEKRLAVLEDSKNAQTDLYANLKNNIGPAINAATKLAEAQALINTEYRRGNISAEQFADATDRITKKQSELKNIMTGLSEDTFGPTFGKYFDMAAKSIGLTQEELDAINTQADALQGVLENLGATAAEEAGNLLRFAMASGQIDAATAGMLPELMQDKRYKVVIDQVIEEGDPGALAELIKGLTQIDMFPDPIQARIMATFDGDWDDPEAVNRWLQEALVNSSFFVDNPNIQMQVMARLNEDPANFTTEYANQLEDFYKKAEQEVGVNLRVRSLEDVENAYKWLKKIKNTKNLKKELNVLGNWQSVFKAFGITYKEFEKLPDISKAIIIDYVTRYTTIQQNVNLAEQTSSESGDTSAKQLANKFLLGARETQRDLGEAASGMFDPEIPEIEDEEDDDGTGGAEKSFLEDFINNINANAQLYLNAEKGMEGYLKNRGKFLGAFQKLRNRGLSEDIISSLGTGPEGLKNAKELLKKNREQIKKLSEASRLDSLGQTVESLRREKGKTKEKTAAARAIKGLSPELQDIVMNDEQFISSFAKVKVGSEEYNKLVKVVQKLANAKRELAEETQTEFEAQEQATKAMIDSLELQIKKNEDDLINAFEKTHGMLPEMMELEISKREESIRVIQKQIDELEELNEIDEERIEGLSRQQEMLERQIEVLDRANEMDQRRIELLNRQDEIRSRESEALSKELDDMSKIEQELRDSHQKRVEQLEKVADVNDYILNQQKQQLNISRAISEGDIYSATAAAQEMRAGSAEFSKRQLISGLEAGLENQVSNLRTSDGLTRDQAERQIANIKEQSYQTSLQIRQIEDMIYQRNQQMIPLKDQQYSLDMQIRDIEDLIYDRNVQKKQIFDEQIDPLQRQNDLQNEYLRELNIEIDHVNGPLKAKQNHLDRILQLEGASQKVTGEIRDMTNRARKKADDLSDSWDDVTRSIFSALGMLSQFNGEKAAKSYAGGIVEGYSKGGKIKGYSVGGVAGNGSRDSVPAMLTPGEFVIRKAMVNKYGQSMMHDINMGSFSMPGYGAPERSSNVSLTDVSVSNISGISAPVYNVYDMNFSINGSNQSAEEIVNRVMVKIKQLQSHNIRSNRGN